jgi:glycyl-tRNA synthetase
MPSENNLMETIIGLCKRRGFIYPGSELYGGMANSWDYGPLGVELKNNIKKAWWKMFVQERGDMVGLDAALVMNPKVWEASGHLATFTDPLVECKECHERYRADQIDMKAACAKCGRKGTFTEPASFNLMMKTFIGPKEDASAVAYFRPETAQAIFVDFPNVLNTSRKRVPFGIAQVGKAFRNEITPGNFIFRTREFEQMEIEYFIHPNDWEKTFESWLKAMHTWIASVGIDTAKIHDLEVEKNELAHYSKRTVDIEFEYPFGKKELYGLAYRTDFDLKSHATASGKDIVYTDPATNEKYVPHVIEPSFGVDRTFLAVMLSCYREEEAPTADAGETDKRIVLKLPYHLAPYKIAVLPLSKKEELASVAESIANDLRKHWTIDYDETQSIGKRYRRQDEIGTPLCITVDFETLTDKKVTVRERDTMKQERVNIAEIVSFLTKNLNF